MASFEQRQVSATGRMTLPAPARRRWGMESGGAVGVLDLDIGGLVVPEDDARRLLDLMYPAEAHHAFVDQDDDPDPQTT